MKYKNLCLIFALTTTGCITPVKLDYIPPTSGPLAQISVTSVAGEYLRNMPVLVHTEKCDYESSKLAGLLYSAAVGVDYAKEVNFSVPANQKVSLSVQAVIKDSVFILPIPLGSVVMVSATTNTVYCRPIVDFFAKAGVSYKVELKASGNTCSYEVQSNESNTWSKVSDAEIRPLCTLPYYGGPKPLTHHSSGTPNGAP